VLELSYEGIVSAVEHHSRNSKRTYMLAILRVYVFQWAFAMYYCRTSATMLRSELAYGCT